MKTRMQPVGSAWRKLPRIVRDICRETGKKIELELDGESAELDRQVLELIKDPLTHMIRNSADHGIEAPDVRVSKGKSETGTIRLSAYHEGGHVIMTVVDDGAGLNTARIRQKAIDKCLVSAADAAAMTDAQIHRFIFAPGFSTASQVTNLSGRGVGMDVVKTNIEIIGGSVELQSTEGQGTSFRIKIPLTLAIVSALILGARGQRFAAPQSSVLELVRVGAQAELKVDHINRTPVLRLREKLLPLIDLCDALLLPAASAQETRYVVVMQVGATRFGVLVDEVHDTEEIVVKPLATLLRGVPMLSGATILGDGSVVAILDPNQLCGALGSDHEKVEENAASEARAQRGEREGAQSLILFRAGSEGLKAAPLMLVTRLEDVPTEAIERADGRCVMQYRGALMPVVHAGGDHLFRSAGAQPVLVFTNGERAFGLAVDEIVDIVHEHAAIDLSADRPGVLGAAVVRGRATEIIDVGYYLNLALDEWVDARALRGAPKGRVLLLEHNAFTRNLLQPLIESAGYALETAPDLDAAWRLHDEGERFDAILADVDADLGAAQKFAQSLAQNSGWRDAALVALSSGRASAEPFADCVRKTDRAQILAALDYALRNKGNAA
jgi:two-component system chemotaxis sensor kinase CheA